MAERSEADRGDAERVGGHIGASLAIAALLATTIACAPQSDGPGAPAPRDGGEVGTDGPSDSSADADPPADAGPDADASSPADIVVPAAASSQCFGMPCCPSGYGMRGADVTQDSLLCRKANQQHEDCFVDHPTRRQGMHACPRGTFMRGMQPEMNVLTCCYERERGYSELLTESLDGSPPHQEFNMHACPVPGDAGGAFMTGIDPSSDRFLCAGTPVAPSTVADPVMIDLDPEAPRTFLTFYPGTPHSMWKAAVRHWLSRLFDIPPDAPYLNSVAVQDEAPMAILDGGVVRRKISYASLVDGIRIPAYLFLPQGYPNGTFPGALVVHGHFQEAKEGLATQWDSPLHAIGLYLAQQGFVTLAPDTRTWGEYAVPGEAATGMIGHDQVTASLEMTAGHPGTLPQQTLLDNLVSVTVLAQQGLGSGSIAVEGLSLGSDQAMWLAAVDDRIGSVILAGNYLSFGCLNDRNLNHSCQTVPGLSRNLSNPAVDLLLDAGDIAALIAPKPLYAMWGDLDTQFYQLPAGSLKTCSSSAADGAKAVYGALGSSTSFRESPIAGMVHEIDTTTSYQFLTGVTPFDQLDYGTQCGAGMHCCPAGKAMGGMHALRNDLICRDILDPAFEGCYTDTGTQRQGAHACAPGYYLRGVQLISNLLTCCHDTRSSPSFQLQGEIVDTGTQVQGMHACTTTTPYMTGLQMAQNQLLCSGI